MEVGLERFGVSSPGTPFRLVARAHVFAPVEDLTLEIKLPVGTIVVEGSSSWSGPATPDRDQVLDVTVQVGDSVEREYFAVLTMVQGSARLERVARLTTGRPGALTKPQVTPAITVDDRGTRLMMLPARVVEH